MALEGGVWDGVETPDDDKEVRVPGIETPPPIPLMIKGASASLDVERPDSTSNVLPPDAIVKVSPLVNILEPCISVWEPRIIPDGIMEMATVCPPRVSTVALRVTALGNAVVTPFTTMLDPEDGRE